MTFILGAISLLVIVVIWPYLGRRFLEKYDTEWTLASWQTPETMILGAQCVFAVCVARFLMPPNRQVDDICFDRVSVRLFYLNIAIVVSGSLMTAITPNILSLAVQELYPIAILQEVFLLLAVVLLALAALQLRKDKSTRIMSIIRPFWVVVTMSLALLFLLLEEISYGQHYIGWETSAVFQGNIQNETNLHNFYTSRFELIYYSGAFVCLCLLPLAAHRFSIFEQLGLRTLIPGPAFGIAAIPVAGAMFESWAIVPYQMYFLVGMAIAFFAAQRLPDTLSQAALAIVSTMVVTQIAFLVYGPQLEQRYAPTEIRELAISATLAAYGFWLYISVRENGCNKRSEPSPLSRSR